MTDSIKYISGGPCAAKGFLASGVHCGIRKNHSKKDLALLYSETPCTAAAVYTSNLVKSAPIKVTKANLSDGRAQAVICNSGNANTCNWNGVEIANDMCVLTGEALGISPSDVIVGSTGVIGQELSIDPIAAGMPALKAALSADDADAAEAIMTTDTKMKRCAVSFTLGGVECHLGGMAKGSGMIHPNMATMLVFIATDAAVSASMLQAALSEDVKSSFNMVSIDGDTSTNDMVSVMANGQAGNSEISAPGADYDVFCAALSAVTTTLCRAIAGDAEGATKLLSCKLTGGKNLANAKKAAKSVICSSLVKTAMFGADANWGRVICALGYSGADIDVEKVGIAFASSAGTVTVCRDGAGVEFSEELAKKVLSQPEVDILVTLGDGSAAAEAWGCDLTYDYVKINGDYRT